MSRIGRKPVIVKEGVTVEVSDRIITAKGQKGAISFCIPSEVGVTIEDNHKVVVTQKEVRAKDASAKYGLTRATIANMVRDVSEGFEKRLELSGVGYRAQVSGKDLMLSVGFSHLVKVPAAEGITFSVAENVITVSGVDRTLVGDIASKIRSIRPPEPYKGKGIRYLGEKIRRKAGKAAKAVGAK